MKLSHRIRTSANGSEDPDYLGRELSRAGTRRSTYTSHGCGRSFKPAPGETAHPDRPGVGYRFVSDGFPRVTDAKLGTAILPIPPPESPAYPPAQSANGAKIVQRDTGHIHLRCVTLQSLR